MVPLLFKIPQFPEKYVYDKEEDLEFDYPPTVLLYGLNGVVRPCLIVNNQWKEEHVLNETKKLEAPSMFGEPAKPLSNTLFP